MNSVLNFYRIAFDLAHHMFFTIILALTDTKLVFLGSQFRVGWKVFLLLERGIYCIWKDQLTFSFIHVSFIKSEFLSKVAELGIHFPIKNNTISGNYVLRLTKPPPL